MFSLVAGGDVVCARRNARAATAEKGGEPVSEPYLESMLVAATPR